MLVPGVAWQSEHARPVSFWKATVPSALPAPSAVTNPRIEKEAHVLLPLSISGRDKIFPGPDAVDSRIWCLGIKSPPGFGWVVAVGGCDFEREPDALLVLD